MTATHFYLLRRFLKQTLLLGLVISLPVYAWVRLIFFEIPFSPSEDIITLTKVIATGWMMMIVLKGTFHLIVATMALVGSGSRELGVGSQESGVCSREFGVGRRESGVCSQESGARRHWWVRKF